MAGSPPPARPWTALAKDHGVVVEVAGVEAPPVHAGAERLRQALDNLIENAVEASAPGGRIVLEAKEVPLWVELRVRDDGPGLTREERERAFDRFWRGRNGGEGSGLGLAIVKRLVESDGGEVELRDAEGGGLEVVLRVRRAGQT